MYDDKPGSDRLPNDPVSVLSQLMQDAKYAKSVMKIAERASQPATTRGLPQGQRRATYVLDIKLVERIKLYAKINRMRVGDVVNDILDKEIPSLNDLQRQEAEEEAME